MNINSIRSENSYLYSKQADSRPVNSFTLFTAEEQQETIREAEPDYDKVPEQFAGMSFHDLMNYSESRKNQIPIVRQIVSAKDPENGEIKTVFFTGREITCHHADGRKAWNIEIADEQQDMKITDFFRTYKPDDERFKEYYSGDNLSMVTAKNFWLNLLRGE